MPSLALVPKVRGAFQGKLDVKRFYLPGLRIQFKCPYCGHDNELDGDERYLSYPEANEREHLHTLCEECDKEITLTVVLKITLRGVPGYADA